MTILSGMSDQEQMADNLNTFRNFEPLTEQEKQVIQAVVQKMQDMPKIFSIAIPEESDRPERKTEDFLKKR